MAEYKFNILTVTPSLKEQSVFIECSLGVDAETATTENILLMQSQSKRIAPFDVIVDNRVIQLKLKEWAEPNAKYLLIVQSGIKSVSGEDLPAALMRDIIFKSQILENVKITSPADFQKINALTVAWQTFDKDKKEVSGKNCYIEVAAENAFYNVLYKTSTTESSILFADLKPGQYFVRARIQDNDQYGAWSKLITFIIAATADNPAPVTPTPQKDPTEETPKINVEDLTNDKPSGTSTTTTTTTTEVIVPAKYVSEYDITPTEFTFTFDKDVNPEGIELVVIRSDV